jgi:hypothetical protein
MSKQRKPLIKSGLDSVEIWQRGGFGSKEYLRALLLEKIPVVGTIRTWRTSKEIAKKTGRSTVGVQAARKVKQLPFEAIKALQIIGSGGTSLFGDLAQSTSKRARSTGKVAQEGSALIGNFKALRGMIKK